MSAVVSPNHPQRSNQGSVNCRVYERQSCELPVACQPAAAFGRELTRWSGTIRDVSQGGLRLILERRFEPGTGLAIELPEESSGETRTVLLKGVHVKRQLDGYWSLGCQFVSELSDDEIQRLLPNVSQGQGEGEGEGDGQGAGSVRNRSRPTMYSEPLTVATVRLQIELSTTTLIECIINKMIVPHTWPLATGNTISIRGGKKSGVPWQFHLRVVQCASHCGRWTLRGQLLNPPAPTALLQAVGRRS